MKKSISIDGMPCAGKTTFLKKFISKNKGFYFFQETYIEPKGFDPTKSSLIGSYAEKELEKKITASGLNKYIILDRSFISTLAFTFAKLRKGDPLDFTFFIDFIKRNLNNIIVPDLVILFLIKPKTSILRRESLKDQKTLDIWFDPDFLESMLFYYKYKKFQEFNLKSKIIIINTDNVSKEELFVKVSEVIKEYCHE